MSLKLKGSCYAYIRFCSLLPFNRWLRPSFLYARSARRRGWIGAELSALQYRAERRERLSHLGCSRWLHRRGSLDRGEGEYADDPRRAWRTGSYTSTSCAKSASRPLQPI